MTAGEWTVTEPGVIADMPFDVYLADPVAGGSLSHSGAKTIVKATPALFDYERTNGRPAKRDFDFGHAAHRIVLGVGPDITPVDAADWRTKAAKEAATEIRSAGGVPVLREEHDRVVAMAKALEAHPTASKLLAPGSGRPEVSGFIQDPETGVWMRCRFDWLRHVSPAGRLLLVDYKTCNEASEEAFGKSAANYGYDMQDAWYTHVARLLGLAEDIKFLFIAQEKSPPHLVNVIQLDITARRIGQHLTRRALATYADCTRTGMWPGYGDDIKLTSLPAWYERAFETDIAS